LFCPGSSAGHRAERVDHARYLLRLAELELIDRERRMVERRIKAARFPATKSLNSFDFKAIPSLNKMMVLELVRSWRTPKLYAIKIMQSCSSSFQVTNA
jgi:DNA replication protein DnaC